MVIGASAGNMLNLFGPRVKGKQVQDLHDLVTVIRE